MRLIKRKLKSMNFYFFFIKTASATPRKMTATIVAAWFVSPVLAIASAEFLSAPPSV